MGFQNTWLALLLIAGSACISNAAELKLHYAFDEGSGTTAASSVNSVAGNTLNLTGAAGWSASMPGYGSAMQITGTTGRAAAATVGTWSAQTITGSSTGSMSMALWVKFDSLPTIGVPTLMGTASTAAKSWHHQMLIRMDGGVPGGTEANAWGNVFGSSGNHLLSDRNAAVIATGVWSHYALTFDSTTKALVFYKNGVQVSTATNALWTGYWDAADLVSAVVGSDASNSVSGLYDDARVYRGAMTAAEVLALFQFSPNPPTVGPLISDDYYVTPGATVNLAWKTTGATSLILNPGNRDLLPLSTAGDGSIPVVVNATTTFTLTATNPKGSTQASVRVGAGPPKPNILFFLVDDMGWQDTSLPFHHNAAGNPVRAPLNDRYRTPNMETFATRGMKFTNAYACPVCTPTRASIMTGMNPARHHITNWTDPSTPRKTDSESDPNLNPPDWRIAGIDTSDITLPTLLQKAGYRTIHVGKAHFAPNSTAFADPRAIGFDVNIAGNGIGGPGSYWGDKNYSAGWRGTPITWDVPGLSQYHGTTTFLTEALTLEMNKEIEKAVADDVPFFAYMAHYAVHAPFEADSRFTANYPGLTGDNLAFATLVEGMDKSLGDILAKLDSLGVADDTLVIFLSDNGTPLSGNAASQTIRSYKGTRYEGGMRVPMMVGWAKPDSTNPFQQALPIPPGSREDDIVACWDMFPTVAGIAGAAYSQPIDGFDLRPYFTATPGSHRPQEFLMHFPNGHTNDFFSVLRQNEWKLILNYDADSYELYNLATDLAETNNLAATNPDRVMAMARSLARSLAGMGAQFPVNTSNGSAHPPLMPALPAVDVDADGIPDNTEDPNRNGLLDPGETDPTNDNSDGDNVNDGAEASLGLNPLDPASFFFLRVTPQSGGTRELTWPSLPGSRFDIRFSPDLADWSSLLEADFPASNPGTTSHYTPPSSATLRGFYRVELK